MQTAVQPESACAQRFPWHTRLLVAAIFSSAIGGPWDISWHMSIGRDTFWTPAHMAIYLGGATAGIVCGWLAIRTTFFSDESERRGAVRLWGGRAPFGAWVAIWGAVAMLASGPFDDWWHNAYGLDVKIISPPHVVLFLGGVAVRLGVWLLVLREQNRGSRTAAWFFCILGGLMVQEFSMIFTNEFWPNRQHSAGYFFLSASTYPFLLATIARASKLRWGATIAAASYMIFVCGLVWILPLFPASPKLGPISHLITHMAPPPFPQWLILPAVVIDLVKRKVGLQPGWRHDLAFAAAVSAGFVLIFLPVQWFFCRFYLSPAADNWFFAGNRIWAYFSLPAGNPLLTEYWADQEGWTLVSVAKAFGAGIAAAFLGRRIGQWMCEVKR
jgi:hypothetical protein